MSQEELRREQQETIEELRGTEDVSGSANRLWGALARGTGWKFIYGGWYSPSYVFSNQNDRDRKTQDLLDHAWENDLKLFLNSQSGTGKTKIYFRAGTQLTQNAKISPAVARSNWVQPGIEMFYIERGFGNKSFRQKWTLGRQYVKVKNTLAFGLVADGIDYELKTRRQAAQLFLLRQKPGDDNVDFLAPRAGRSKRWFYGAEYNIRYLALQQANVFAVGNIDANDDAPDAEGQRHRFDSLYLGLTFYGSVFSRLEYEFQYIKEFGTTFSDSGNLPGTAVDVNAQALYAGFKYYFYSDLKPVAHLDYLYGSGDDDAVGNVFSTSGGSGSAAGSGAGGSDRRFIPFGGKNLGYALAPTLTNLHVVKTGISVKPFGWSKSRVWKDIKIHPQYYMFWRDKAAGAASDPYMLRGAGSSRRVGDEIDLSVTWRLMSDVNYTLKFGFFNPGPAYATRSDETFVRLKFSIDL
ncbi:alginate export family protein [bacterium]|nr:alginate export family protein [bacterium]